MKQESAIPNILERTIKEISMSVIITHSFPVLSSAEFQVYGVLIIKAKNGVIINRIDWNATISSTQEEEEEEEEETKINLYIDPEVFLKSSDLTLVKLLVTQAWHTR